MAKQIPVALCEARLDEAPVGGRRVVGLIRRLHGAHELVAHLERVGRHLVLYALPALDRLRQSAAHADGAILHHVEGGDGGAAIVGGPHVGIARVHHGDQEGAALVTASNHGRAVAVRRVPEDHAIHAARAQLAAQRRLERPRHALRLQMAPNHHARRRAINAIIHQLVAAALAGVVRWLLGAHRPLRLVLPLVYLLFLPLVQRLDPILHVVNALILAGNEAEAIGRSAGPPRAHEAAMHKEGAVDDFRELAELDVLAHEATLLHRLDKRRHHAIVRRRPLLRMKEFQFFSPAFLLAGRAHGVLEHPAQPIPRRVVFPELRVPLLGRRRRILGRCSFARELFAREQF